MAPNKQNNLPAHVGIDIGNSQITCVIGIQEPSSPVPSIIGVGRVANSGMRKGQVVDIEEVVHALTKAVDEAERISGYAVDRATIGVGGSNVLSINSKGVIAVGGVDKEIEVDDVHRVEEAAAVVQLPPNREILQVFSRSYRLDGQDNIKDPVGMSGVRLEVDAHIVTVSTPALKNVERCLLNTGIQASQFIVNVIAAGQVVLDKKQKENGTAILDIGSATTGIAIFEEGELLHTAILPVGSGHITNDLAIGLKTDLDTAEHVKKTLGDLGEAAKAKTHKITEKDSKNERSFKQKDVDMIIKARLSEIFSLVNQEFKKADRAGKLPGGVVLVGGGANLQGIEDFAKKALSLNAKVAKPSNFTGIIDSAGKPEYSAAVGLMMNDLHLGYSAPGWNFDRSVSKGTNFIKSLIARLKP